MPPNGRIWQELTWSWAYSTGHPASDQRMEAAAKAAWSYALLCAWTYLNDNDSAHDLMDHAIQGASDYVRRHPEAATKKLVSRLKDLIRVRATRLGKQRSREAPARSLSELEHLSARPPEAEQRAIASEIFERLSPMAQSVVNLRLAGYSWREIGGQLEMHHSVVRRAYFRELESVLRDTSQRGDVRPCA
jgi:DNA-binding NarL/FixJ family response regulator